MQTKRFPTRPLASAGTLWKISKETEDIIYAVDLNHKKERHLNGAVIETFNRPGLLITDAYTALRPPSNARADKDLSGAA